MSRSKSWIAIAVIILVATALAAVALPQKAEAASLKGKLHFAKLALRHSNYRLKVAEAALAAAVPTDGGLAADPTAAPSPAASSVAAANPTVAELRARVDKARRAVRAWMLRVQRLAKQYRLERKMAIWESRGKWMPIIEVAAARYHVRADGIYRMMMRESGGRRFAGSGSSFKGLFQYYPGTWAASWNPWRGDSIYDGSSQILATCYAVSKGMGGQMWSTTYFSQY